MIIFFISSGATFAYFSASNSTSGSNVSQTNVTTKTIGDTTFTFANDGTKTNSKIDYPGGIALMKATATAKLDAASDTGNAYDFTYSLSLTGTSGVATELKWHLYELTEANEQSLQSTLGTKFGVDTCKLVVDSGTAGETHLYYADGGEDCTAKKLGIATQLSSYEIASGTLKKTGGLENTKEDHEGFGELNGFERKIENVNNSTGVKKYYYLVLEYPNEKTSDQATGDQGQNIKLELKLVDESVSVELAG